MRKRALDLFCGGGGAAEGLRRAGFDVTGIDIEDQPHYPFPFIRASAMQIEFRNFDFVWASPPCQEYSPTRALHDNRYPKLIAPVRAQLRESGALYCIENVPGAPLENPICLCGTMFGLRLLRHRHFETNFKIQAPQHRPHRGTANSHRGLSTGGDYITVAGNNYRASEGRKAMGIPWLPRNTLSQAIPPAYSEFIGRVALRRLRHVA